MAKSDAEITLQVNMPPPNEFKRQLKEFEKLAGSAKKTLGGFGEEMKNLAEGVRIMGERAKATGSAAMLKTVEGSFVEGFGKASTMDVRAAKVSKGVSTLESRVGSVRSAYEAGELGEEQAVALMRKYVEQAQKADEAASDLNYTLEATRMDMADAAPTDEMLAKFDAFCHVAIDARAQAHALADELRDQADAFAEEREELDARAPGYEAAALKLMQLEKEYRGLEASARAAGNAAGGHIDKVKAAAAEFDGSAEAQKKYSEAIAKGYDAAKVADEKLSKVAAQRAMNEQKRAADEEKAQKKKEEDAKKEAERAEAKEKREAELAAQREAREAAMAARDAERAEKEQFAMELSLLNKDQLIKKIKELQIAREKAAKEGDFKTYEKRTREFMQAREQMEKVNTQLNLTRMAWSQQMQMANQFAGSLGNVAKGLSNIGENAKNGQLDLVGLAGAAQEAGTSLVMMMQMGMGPIGALMLALQGLQMAWNHAKEAERERNEALKVFNKGQEELANLLKKNTEEQERFNRQQANTKAVQELVKNHQYLNDELEREIANIEKAAAAELYRMGLNDDAAEHAMRMQKAALGRQLASGQITQEQYAEQVAQLQFARDNERLDERVAQARVMAEAAAEKVVERQRVYDAHGAEVGRLQTQRRGMAWSAEKVTSFEAGRQRNEALIQQRTAEYQKLLEEEGDSQRTEEARMAMLNAVNAAADYEQEGWAMIERYFGEKAGTMTLDEGLKEYAAKMEAIDGKLAAAEQIRAEAERGLEAARKEEEAAEAALDKAETGARIGKQRLQDTFDSDAETRRVNAEQKEKREKRQKRLEDLRNKADGLTENELEARLRDAQQARAGAQDEHEREYATSLVDLYSGRLKGRRESERERLARVANATDLLDAGGRKLMRGFDGRELLNVMDDGRVSKSELAKLKRAYDVARKADNEEAMAMVKEIVRDALESKKQSAKTKRIIARTFEL